MVARAIRSETLRHGALVFGGVAFASLFNYLYYMLLGRRVDVAGYGAVTSLASALLVIGAPAVVAQLIAARLAADLQARGDRAALRRLADLATRYAAAAVAIIAVGGFVGRESIAGYFQLRDTVAVDVTIVALALFFVQTVQRGVLQGAHYFGDYAASMSLEALVKVAVGIPLAGSLGAVGALIGLVCGGAAALVFNAVAFHRRFGTRGNAVALERALIWRVFTHVGLGQLTVTVLMFYDVPLVKHFFDPVSAGLYAAAALVGRAVISAVSFVPTLTMPKTTARVAARRSPLPLLGVAVGLACGFVTLAAIAGYVAPRFVVSLIAGKQFAAAGPLVLPYIGAAGALSIASVVISYKAGLHRYDFVIPVLTVASAEVVTIALWHPSTLVVVLTLLVGHGCLLASTLFRVASAPALQDIGAHPTEYRANAAEVV